jgi:hypothetical protein
MGHRIAICSRPASARDGARPAVGKTGRSRKMSIKALPLPSEPASSLYQIEVSFSLMKRQVLTPNDLTDLDAVKHRLLAFQER